MTTGAGFAREFSKRINVLGFDIIETPPLRLACHFWALAIAGTKRRIQQKALHAAADNIAGFMLLYFKRTVGSQFYRR
jgi:hypothetical protein